IEIAGQARNKVEDFLKEEEGHDRILAIALKSIVNEYESVPTSEHVKVLMAMLRFSAERNFLAFALNVDFFERGNFQEIDPFAEFLRRCGFAVAARQIERHTSINDAGGHDLVAHG